MYMNTKNQENRICEHCGKDFSISEEELVDAKELSKGRLLLRMEDSRSVAGWVGGRRDHVRGDRHRRGGHHGEADRGEALCCRLSEHCAVEAATRRGAGHLPHSLPLSTTGHTGHRHNSETNEGGIPKWSS